MASDSNIMSSVCSVSSLRQWSMSRIGFCCCGGTDSFPTLGAGNFPPASSTQVSHLLTLRPGRWRRKPVGAPNRLERLIEFQPAIGIADTPHELFLGTDAVKVGEPTDVTEAERVSWLPRAEVPALIVAGLVHDAPTLIGLLLLAQAINPRPGGGSLVTPRAPEAP